MSWPARTVLSIVTLVLTFWAGICLGAYACGWKP